MLYRQVPRDFTQVYVEIGWGGIESYYHAHAKTIKRWIIICGRDALRKARAEYVRLKRIEMRQRVANDE